MIIQVILINTILMEAIKTLRILRNIHTQPVRSQFHLRHQKKCALDKIIQKKATTRQLSSCLESVLSFLSLGSTSNCRLVRTQIIRRVRMHQLRCLKLSWNQSISSSKRILVLNRNNLMRLLPWKRKIFWWLPFLKISNQYQINLKIYSTKECQLSNVLNLWKSLSHQVHLTILVLNLWESMKSFRDLTQTSLNKSLLMLIRSTKQLLENAWKLNQNKKRNNLSGIGLSAKTMASK